MVCLLQGASHERQFRRVLSGFTDRQGRSGLGLEAQQKAVQDYLNGGAWSLLAELTEVETGVIAQTSCRRSGRGSNGPRRRGSAEERCRQRGGDRGGLVQRPRSALSGGVMCNLH
jgi:hypothetical protein